MIGLLVMAYGGPNNIDEVEPYLLDVRNYRPTSRAFVDEVRERYRQIGGRSPILERTRAQAEALRAALNKDGPDFKVFLGMRHWRPFIKDALGEMSGLGIEKAVGLVMAPHYSYLSIGAYYKKIEEAGSAIEMARIERWNLLPGYLEALAGRVSAALEFFPANVRADVPIIFTAHSLPQRILEYRDPYPEELRATFTAIAERFHLHPCTMAYQSAANSGEPWLGPDASALIDRYAAEGKTHILMAPFGFVCEHVEVLYDIDIVYKKQAGRLGVALERIEMLNTAPQMIEGLADLVRCTAKEKNWL